MEEIEGNKIEEKGDVSSIKNPESEKLERSSTSEIAIECTTVKPQLTLKRIAVLISLTLLWVSAAAPVFFITASLCTNTLTVKTNLAFIEAEIGGQMSAAWIGMANTLATAATAPFAGAICDLIGRRQVSLLGLVFIFVGMTVMGTAQRMDVAIGGTSLVGVGAGLAEMVASAGVMELVPVRARGKYVGILYVMYLPVCGCQAYG